MIQAKAVLGPSGVEGPRALPMHPVLGDLLRQKGAEATAAYGCWSRAVELQHDLPLGTASVRGQMPKAHDSDRACQGGGFVDCMPDLGQVRGPGGQMGDHLQIGLQR